jgi:SAM-dependent methyltransferase
VSSGNSPGGIRHLLSLLIGEAQARALRLRRMDGRLAEMERLQAQYQREMRLLFTQMTLPPPEQWRDGPPQGPDPAGIVFDTSPVCRQDSFETYYFHRWMNRLGLPPRYHRKLWEFAFVMQVLEGRGQLRPGSRGLGFGVGQERLTAYFASQGCHITATDLAGDDAAIVGWTETGEHAAGKETLRYPPICPDPVFDANVDFRVCDMNAVPDDLTGYDFCWSACALEHLGSIEKGLAFIERSIRCLKPGGIAVHTTEFNLDSDDETVEDGLTVIFRKRDLVELMRRVTAAGCVMAPLDLEPGRGEIDRYIDLPPYRADPHLTLSLWGYKTTSVGVIIQAPLS